MAMVASTEKPGSSSSNVRHMFNDGFVERHDLEQYFWTTTTVSNLRRALSCDPNLCCLATPSLAHAFHVEEPKQEVRLLDIDTRFSYLPGFRFWDIRRPEPLGESETFRVVVFDPPFFYIPMAELYRAVLEVCKGDTKTKLLIGFLVREQASLLEVFKEFGLVRTKFVLEYAAVKSNKWRNYALYSNVDLPGIKRIRKP
ncbi:hypothetical protein M758_9G115500 [Ceratodon purpureus]|uniref:Uncharacterized protein n=1 Tax=Ceratodon purpureus TaxID=3225 RepID=A0A8T0GTJ3_CERPU|nr:hypothetical protein KC19_9G099900 [Ceratodon purpureus]KAG0606121.1 hypothetical protein M758_9G115500 [Ceratodon purpureus]